MSYLLHLYVVGVGVGVLVLLLSGGQIIPCLVFKGLKTHLDDFDIVAAKVYILFHSNRTLNCCRRLKRPTSLLDLFCQ